jgi:hypothetical protein
VWAARCALAIARAQRAARTGPNVPREVRAAATPRPTKDRDCRAAPAIAGADQGSDAECAAVD